jgi:zinc protease
MTYLYYTAPRFSEEEFAASMNQLKAVVPNLVSQPNFKLQTELVKVIYGENPRRFVISPEMLDKVSVPTIERVYKSLFSNAAGSVVRIVGNVNPEEIKPLVEKYIGSIPTGKKAPKWVDTKEELVKGHIHHHFDTQMTTPKSTVILVASADMKNTLQNTVVSSAVNYILDLIYTETIREEEGGTYGVSSMGSISELPKNKYVLQIAFDTDPEKAHKLIELAHAGLNSLAENGPSADYLAKAKENFLKNIPENHISNSYWKGQLGDYYRYGKDFDTEYEKVVKALTAEQVQAFVKEVLSQENFIEFIMRPE